MNISIKYTEPETFKPIKDEVITIKYNKEDDFSQIIITSII